MQKMTELWFAVEQIGELWMFILMQESPLLCGGVGKSRYVVILCDWMLALFCVYLNIKLHDDTSGGGGGEKTA